MNNVRSYTGAADYLEHSPRGFARVLARGEGPKSFFVGRRRLFRETDLQEWVASRVR